MSACQECGDLADEFGCFHDGRVLCSSCLHLCRECLAAMTDDLAAERVRGYR